MSEQVMAAASIEVGEHWEWDLFGLTLNADTIVGTLIAGAVVLGLGLLVRFTVTSGVPNGIQLFFESITKFVRDQVESTIGVRTAPYLVPVGLGLFVFILTCNWLGVLPIDAWLGPPTADVNLVYALVIVVFVGWHVDGIRRHRNPGKHLVHITKGHWAPFAPLWLLEQFFVYPVSLSLRLFGNIFAGGILITLFTLLPPAISWAPNAGWKLFDMFIGAIQAVIFVLLTIVYFSESIPEEEGAH